MLSPASVINQHQPREQYGAEDPGFPGLGAAYQAPQNGSVQGQSAAGAAPNQAQRTFPTQFANPTNTDIIIYTVPNINTTLAAAISGTKPQTLTLASAAGIIPGMLLSIADPTNPEKVWVMSVNQSANTVVAVCAFPHASGLAVTCARTFFLTDYTVTTSSGSQHVALLKARTTISSGAITTGSHAVTFNNPSITAQNGDITFVGATVYMEDPSSGSYEAVVVTAVSRNSAGIITGFTATFVNAHASNAICSFPVEVAYVNNTKGIEAIGIETQATVPPGMSLTAYFGAVSGTVQFNAKGFEQ